jgi:diguanylate cyclase (GGDEF)-like protein
MEAEASTTTGDLDDRLGGTGSERARVARSRSLPDLSIWLFTALLGAGGIGLYFLVVRDLAPIEAPIGVTWWMLAIAFALTEVFVAHVTYRDDAQTYSLSEVPLLVGLCFAGPSALVAGRLLGALVALTVHRRQSGLKLAFNLGLFLLLDGCIAQVVFRALLQGHEPLHPLGWAAAYATLMLTDTLSGLAIALVTRLHQGLLPASAVRRDLAFGLLVAIVNVTIGLITVTTLWYDPTAFVLLLVVAGIMVLAYRGYVSLTAMYERLQRLFAFTCSSSETTSSEHLSSLGLRELRDAVKASYVELTLFQGQESLRWELDDAGPGHTVGPLSVSISDDERCLLQAGRLYAAEDQALLSRANLGPLGLRQMIVAPLREGGRISGSVLVGTRSAVKAFRQEDVSTLQTLANHLAVTLKNARLVEQLREEAQVREHEALHDALTDLPNRRAFLAEAAALIEGAGAGQERFALLLLDLSDFSEINDTLGHPAGDKALIELGSRFLGLGDVRCAHLGGDEFAFLLAPPVDPAAALRFGCGLRDLVSRAVPIGSFTAQLRASVGVVLYPDQGSSGEELLRHAEMALRAAKETPQGIALFGAEHDTSSPRRLALAAELQRAVAQGDIQVAYQPQVDLASGCVVGVEALARWSHPRLGEVSPEEFIPVAENTGAIWGLTTSVLQRSLSEMGPMLRSRPDLRLAVNLSVRCLYYDELPGLVGSLLAEEGVRKEQVALEVTESSLMTDFARFQVAVARLIASGFTISVDDFGIGYSSLAYIEALRPAEVKVDRSFVAELLQSQSMSAIVKSVIDLSHAVGARCVAEGVEDRSTMQRLRTMGCDVAQGFYLSRPLAHEALCVWLPENDGSLGAGRLGEQPPRRALQALPGSG